MNTERRDVHSPTDEQVEARLRAALAASATAKVASDRPAPSLDLSAPAGRPLRGALVLSAAAAAAVLAVGVAVAVDRPDPTVPASPNPVPSSSAPTEPTQSASPSATPTPTGSPTPSTTTPPAPSRTAIGPASLVVPEGYRLREHTGTGSNVPIGRRWCLDTDGSRDCAVEVTQMDADANPLNSDVEGGYSSNPQLCTDGEFHTRRDLVEYRDVEVGGRAGEYRRWQWGCADGSTVDVAQATVVTPGAWTVLALPATPDARAAMADVVASLELPAATSTVRLYERGVLRAVENAGDGRVTLRIDRVVANWPNSNPATYDYRAPADLRVDARPVAELVGKTVTVWTDGTVVVQAAGG